MHKNNRRKFLKQTAIASAAIPLASTLACQQKETTSSSKPFESGNIQNPLDVIQRENIRITDIKVTPLSYVPPDGKFLWGVGTYMVWKTDAALVEVFTDQGIVGFAEGSPYSNPAEIKKYTDKHVT
ncbi:MAG: twin-arginine translocation signal domain-containing protein, partial [Saprospiraceae bacterium]|nr:twin-arginine translocation signal domain-containing protein [Saprospiraceae bacterium]